MNTTALQQTPTWSGAIAHTATEFGPLPLAVIAGAIPPGLRGSLYRNGPARLERGGQRVGHWFDGDGGILAVQCHNGTVTGTYRYVQTAGYQMEEHAGKFLLGGYGMVPSGRLWERWGKAPKHAANTSVLALPDKLLALWEGGAPYGLDLETLETDGLDDLDGLNGRPYSAHPKQDAKTGDIFNFGVTLGANATLHLYRSDRTGKLRQQGTVSLKELPIIHDFVLAGRYLIFCIPPVRLNALPVLAQLKSYSDSLTWQPEKGTEILVIDRDTLQLVTRLETAPWYQWHFGNGYELADGSVALTIARYPDFQTNQRLKEVATGQIETRAIATLWQLRLDPRSGKVLECDEVLNRSCEFPVVSPTDVGQPSRYTYLNLHSPSADTQRDLFGAIARFDHHTGNLMEANLGKACYPSEPIYAPDADDPEQGWILTVVYDGEGDRSEVLIYAADQLDQSPICRLALPSVVPLSFHGTWQAG